MGKTKHDKVAERIAKKQGTRYNEGPGADIQNSRRVIEVESPNTIGDAARQLQGHPKPAYIAVTGSKAIPKAIKYYAGTTIGVMGPSGKIFKRSTRGRKK